MGGQDVNTRESGTTDSWNYGMLSVGDSNLPFLLALRACP